MGQSRLRMATSAACLAIAWQAVLPPAGAGTASTAPLGGVSVLAISLSSWADIVERVSPSVVSITHAKGLGSGFVIDPQGYIVTNNHVMSGLSEAEVRFSDGNKYKARLVGRDEATDIALLKVDAPRKFPALKFHDDKRVRVGDLVLAVGNPFGLNGTVTAGILSARGRDEIGSGQFTDYLQLDAAINPGNSGGPTFDDSGRVIGVNTLGRAGSGIGFAVPSSTVMRVVDDLKQGRAVQRGYLGVQIESLTDEGAKALGLPNANGALVTGVIAGSPAERAGIRRGDVILRINGQILKDNRELARRIAALEIGETATFTIWRDNATITVKVTAGRRDQMLSEATVSPGWQQTSIGLALQSITDTVRTDFRLSRDAGGVLVMGIDPQSDAAARNLGPGDRIVAVGSVEVSSLADINLALEKAKAMQRESVLLFVVKASGETRQETVRIVK